MEKTSKYRNHKFKCIKCGIIYSPKNHKKIGTTTFCSVNCRRLFITSQKIEKSCLVCKENYMCILIHNKRSVTCSQKCYDFYRYNQIIAQCKLCGDDVKRRESTNSKDGLFCSRYCFGLYKAYYNEPDLYQRKKLKYNVINGIKISCEKCNIDDTDLLTVHHIDHDKKNNEILNLMLLCYNCHYKIHNDCSVNIPKYIKLIRDAKNAIEKRQIQKNNR